MASWAALRAAEVVERWMEVIQADLPDIAQLVEHLDLHAWGCTERRQNVDRRYLEVVNLARHQGRCGRLRVGHDVPDDAVEQHAFAAGDTRGRLAARHVVRVALVDHPAAGTVFGFDELERSGTDVFGDLGVRVGRRDLGLHHHAQRRAGLGQGIEQQAVGFLEYDAESLLVHHRRVGDTLEQVLPGAVLGLPAANRCHAVARCHGGAVVPLQPRAQLEGVGLAVGRDVGLAHHLRLWLEVRIDAEQRVVHHRAVVGRHVLCGPDRVQHAEITVRHHARLPWRPRLRTRATRGTPMPASAAAAAPAFKTDRLELVIEASPVKRSARTGSDAASGSVVAHEPKHSFSSN